MARTGKLTRIQRDRIQAKKLAGAEAQPYYTAANRVQGEIDRSMTNTEIDKIYGSGYTIAGGSAAGYAPALTASSGNVGSLISGIASTLPGGSTDYGVTSLVAGATDEAKSNAILAGLYSKSAGIDVGTAAAKALLAAKGRRDAQDADLRKEQRGYRMQGDTISNDSLKQLATLLGIRASRENLALLKLQTEAQRLANENAGRGGGGGGGGDSVVVGGNDNTDPMAGVSAADIARYDPTGGAGTGYGTSAGANSGVRGGFVSGSTSTSQPASTTTTSPNNTGSKGSRQDTYPAYTPITPSYSGSDPGPFQGPVVGSVSDKKRVWVPEKRVGPRGAAVIPGYWSYQ